MLVKYGGTTTLNSSLKDKVMKTVLSKYGTLVGKSKEVRAKIDKTNLEKYGGRSPCANSDIAKKAAAHKRQRAALKHQTSIEALGFTFEEPLTSIHADVCVKCHCGYSFKFQLAKIQRYPRCPKCVPMSGSSSQEKELGAFIEGLGIKVERRTKIAGVEIDLLLPTKNIGIEFHGLYWHSTAFGEFPKRHQSKMQIASKNGIQLIQIFEDEYRDKPEIVKSILRNKLGLSERRIFARKCEVRAVSKTEANLFFEKTHIAGSARGTQFFGLYFQNELVACVSIAKARYEKTNAFELIRFATALNTSVPGALSRLLSYCPSNLISYCDLRWGTGIGYLKAGFRQVKDTEPGYFYIVNKSRVHRSMLQKKNLAKLSNLDSSATEKEMAATLGYNRIYDAGHRKFIK
jgi:predicted Zn-ribbon and HTH transcriptional regulator